MASPRLVLDVKASRSEAGRALNAVRTFTEELGLPEDLSTDIHLAVDETLANIIIHGYGEDGTSSLTLTAKLEPPFILLEITDRAAPFDPARAPRLERALGPGTREPGGFGVHIIHSVAHAVTYRRDDEENRLVLRWRLPSPERDPGNPG